ncbi:hypothetical protein BCR44DRAFT_1428554, partial [Catenaria anguillulae PL171]
MLAAETTYHPSTGFASPADADSNPNSSRVLVILPPSHKHADVDRVLGLARRAFADQSLSLVDLCLRFAKVSKDDLVLGSDPPSAAADSPHTANGNGVGTKGNNSNNNDGWDDDEDPNPITTLPPPLFTSMPKQPNPAAGNPPHTHKLFVSNLSTAAADSDLKLLLPPGLTPEETSIHAPAPRGPRKEIVRAVTFIFKSEADTVKCYKWVMDQYAKGALAKLTLPQVKLSIPNPPRSLALAAEAHPEASSKPAPSAATAYSHDGTPSATTVPAATDNSGNGKSARSVPEPPPTAPFINVSNLQPTLSETQILTSLVPHPIKLAGAIVHPARMVGPHKELVKQVKLAFKSLDDAQKCHDWIKEHAVEKGTLANMVIKKTRISVTRPIVPKTPTAAADGTTKPSPAMTTAVAANAAQEQQPADPQAPAPSPYPPASPNHYRLHVANLHTSLPDSTLLSLLPPDVPLAGATLYPARPIGPRALNMRSVTFAFKDNESAHTCYEWIKEYDAGGKATQMTAVKGIKVWVSKVVGPGETLREMSAAAADQGQVDAAASKGKGKAKGTVDAAPQSAPPSRSQSRASTRTSTAGALAPAPAPAASASAPAPTANPVADQPIEPIVTINGINPESPVTTVMGLIL